MKSSNKKISFSHFWVVIALFVFPTVCLAQGKIAFHSFHAADGSAEIYVMNPDGSNPVNVTNTGGNDVWPSISPDGSKITFQSDRDGNNEIYVMNIDGSNPVRLTNNPESDNRPSYGPNGKIVFHSFRDDGGNGEIYIMNDDGTGQTRLTTNTVGDANASMSHDGTKILFTVQLMPGIDTDIYVMNADGTGRARLTFDTAYEGSPSFSPDDTRILYQKGLVTDGEIWTMTAAGGGFVRLTDNTDHDENPAYSPDGTKVAFQSDRGIYPLTEVYTMNSGDGSNQVRITSSSTANGGLNGGPSWGVEANAAPTISATGQSVKGDTTGSYSIGTVSDAEDAENTLSVTIDGGSSSTKNGVTVSGIGVNASGALSATIAASCGASNASFTLRVTDSGGKTTEATLNVTVTAEDQDPVLVLPDNIVTYLALNSSDISKVVNFTAGATDNCDGSPTVVASPPSGSAFSVGTTTVNVTATDASGNAANGSFTVTVFYNFAGFFQPVDNLPTLNMATGGQSIPIKFSLSGNKGMNIIAPGFPVSQQIPCTGGVPVDTIDETVTAGSSTLTYDATADRYQYVWKTEKSWRGTCRQLTVKLKDGSSHIAWFQFR
jgi:dipeptidyl aminopeptidase/acylaminoacyl peptidase